MLRILIPLFGLCTFETLIFGLLLVLVLWVMLFLLMWGWIYLWNRKWVGTHTSTLLLILLIAFALPAATMWINMRSADKVLCDKYRLSAEVHPLNGWLMRGVLDEIPAYIPEEQQAEQLFSALCRKTKCLLPYETSHFVAPAELHDTLQALYRTRTHDRERERIYQNNKEQLDRHIRRSLAEAQYDYNEEGLRKWACLSSNPFLRTIAIFWLSIWGVLLARVAYADIRHIYPA